MPDRFPRSVSLALACVVVSASPALLEASAALAGVALILGGVAMVFTGHAAGIGESIRDVLQPVLASIREGSERSRAELADRSLITAAALAMASYFIDGPNIITLILAMAMIWLRPMVQDLTQDENELQAMASQLSSDIVLGLYAIVAMAQALFGNYALSASFLAVVVALSWPAMGTVTNPWKTY